MSFRSVHAASLGNISEQDTTPTPKKHQNLCLLLLYCTFSVVGCIGGPFLQRLYYMNGGNLKWFQSCLQSIGFFVLLPPLLTLYIKDKLPSNAIFMDLKLFFASASLGTLAGFNNYMYSAGLSYIPVSTSSLLFSSQLAFTAVFAFLIVKQKFTIYSLNSVLLITFGSIVLGLHTSSDKPVGVTKKEYLLGFFLTLGGAAMTGLVTPLVELAYSKTSRTVTVMIVLQVQLVINLFAALVSIVGMIINKDFQIIPREAKEFSLGEGKYYMIMVALAILWQMSFLGIMGMISVRSALFVGIFISGLLPIVELASVVTFHEKFTGEKGLSLALSLWGFASYFIGEVTKNIKTKPVGENIQEDGVVDENIQEVVDTSIELDCPNQIERTESSGKFETVEV